jgi:hypothetical protein
MARCPGTGHVPLKWAREVVSVTKSPAPILLANLVSYVDPGQAHTLLLFTYVNRVTIRG